MGFIVVAPGTTWCPDTPENRKEFEELKARLLSGNGRSKTLSGQIAKENKQLRKLRSFLPGHEPDRFHR